MSVRLLTHVGFERVALEKPSHISVKRAPKIGMVHALSNKRLSNVILALLAKVVFHITAAAHSWLAFSLYIAESRERRADEELVRLAKGDRRELDDIRAARDRQEWAP